MMFFYLTVIVFLTATSVCNVYYLKVDNASAFKFFSTLIKSSMLNQLTKSKSLTNITSKDSRKDIPLVS